MGEVVSPVETYRRIALDTSIFIYQFESHSTFGGISDVILRLIWDGRIEGVASIISLMELTTGPYKYGQIELADLYETRLVGFSNLTLQNVDLSIARAGAVVRARYGFPLPDAIHLATALRFGADTFVTNDRRLQQFDELPVTLLSDLVH
jgi:uncharacterized protein